MRVGATPRRGPRPGARARPCRIGRRGTESILIASVRSDRRGHASPVRFDDPVGSDGCDQDGRGGRGKGGGGEDGSPLAPPRGAPRRGPAPKPGLLPSGTLDRRRRGFQAAAVDGFAARRKGRGALLGVPVTVGLPTAVCAGRLSVHLAP